MNPKHLRTVLVLAGILVCVPLGMMFGNQARSLEMEKVEAEEQSLQATLAAERDLLTDLQRQSAELLEFVGKWLPYFGLLEEKQSVETSISMKVREADMLTLSQRYQEVPHKVGNKDIGSLPALIRASLLFDDKYDKLLNWFGFMERDKPTMRVGKISLSKGSRGDDLRMELVLEAPLLKEKAEAQKPSGPLAVSSPAEVRGVVGSVASLRAKLFPDQRKAVLARVEELKAQTEQIKQQRAALEEEIVEATDLEAWVLASVPLQPLVVGIIRSIGPQSEIVELSIERDAETPSQLRLKLKLNTASDKQLDDILAAMASRNYSVFNQTQTRVQGNLVYSASLLREPNVEQRQAPQERKESVTPVP